MTQKQPDKSELEIHHAEVLEVAEDAQDGAVYDLTEDGDKRRRDSIFTITASELKRVVPSKEELRRVPSLVNLEAHKVVNALNRSPQYDPFTKKSFLSLLFSMVLNLSDYGSDIVVAVLLYNERDTDWWFALTVLLIFIPLILVNLFSIFWYHQDHNRQRNTMTFREGGFCPVKQKFSKSEDRFIVVFHLLLLGPLLRFIHILYCGYKEYTNRMENTREALAVGPYCYHPKLSQNTMNTTLNRTGNQFYLLRKYYQRDSAYLGLIEAFIQDGPQLILQLYILAVRHHDDLSDPYTAVFQAISVFLSLFSLSMTLVSYIQASRWADPSKPQMTPMGYIFNFGWRFFVVFSRVFMLSLFATVFKRELFVFLGFHWLLMSTFIFLMGTNFCGSAENRRRPLAEILYNVVMGFVYIFDYIHLKEGPTRLKHFFYYSVLTMEAAILMALWYIETNKKKVDLDPEDYVIWAREKWYQWTGIIGIPGCFLLGMVFMITYYRFYHPEGKMPARKQTATLF